MAPYADIKNQSDETSMVVLSRQPDYIIEIYSQNKSHFEMQLKLSLGGKEGRRRGGGEEERRRGGEGEKIREEASRGNCSDDDVK